MLYDVEEDFDLGVAPKRARFSALAGGASRHLMVNGSAERIAVKVKCSNNRLFRIAPVYTTLEPGCAQRLQVVRDPGQPGMDKLIVLYTHAPADKRNAREVFAACDKTRVRRLLIALDAREEETEAEAEGRKEGGSAGRRSGEGSSTGAGTANSLPADDGGPIDMIDDD